MNSDFYAPSEVSRQDAALPPNEDNTAEIRRHFSKLGLAYLVMTAAFMAAAYGLQYAVWLLHPSLLSEWWFSWAVSLLPLYGVGLPLLLLLLRRVPASPHNTDYTLRGVTDEKPRFHVGHWLILLAIAFACTTAGSVVGNIIMAVLSAVMDYDYAFSLNSMVQSTPVWFTFVCTCICAPLGEELLFRKLLIDRTRRYGDLTSILLSGLLFGLFHGNLFQFFYAAMVGMILAYVYTRSGKYWWCVAMHAAINLMGSIVIPSLAAYLPTAPGSAMDLRALLVSLVILLWQYGMLACGIALLCVFLGRRKLSVGRESPEEKRRFSVILLNPGMIAYGIVLILLLLVSLIPVR